MFQKRFLILLVLTLLLTGCGKSTVPAEGSAPSSDATEPPIFTTAVETEAIPPETTPPPTQPLLPALAIPGVSAEDVIAYFNEVCLDAEITHSGDPSLLQKWTAPIRYTVFGSPTEEDKAVLTGFVDWLNTIEGFPGIAESAGNHETNLRIYFCTQEELIDRMGDNFTGMDGAVTFWYEENVIYDAIICIRTDLHQELRNSVILEELYNGLGPIQDTWLREDSIIYAGYSEPQELTAVDELVLKLLYRRELQCGMDARECEILIRELYF